MLIEQGPYFENKSGRTKHVTSNILEKELAEPPYQRIYRFSNKSLQNHIEGSETDYIERGLQNQYQSWDYNPEIVYGWPFHKRTLKFPRRFRCSRLRIFRFVKIVMFDDFIYIYIYIYMSPIQLVAKISIVATLDPWNKANDGLWWNYIFYKNLDFLDFCFRSATEHGTPWALHEPVQNPGSVALASRFA